LLPEKETLFSTILKIKLKIKITMSKISDELKESKLYEKITANMSKEEVVIMEKAVADISKLFEEEILGKLKKLKREPKDI